MRNFFLSFSCILLNVKLHGILIYCHQVFKDTKYSCKGAATKDCKLLCTFEEILRNECK